MLKNKAVKQIKDKNKHFIVVVGIEGEKYDDIITGFSVDADKPNRLYFIAKNGENLYGITTDIKDGKTIKTK